MHLHTRAVRMFEQASAPFEESKSGDKNAGSDAEVLVDANVGAGKPEGSSRSPTGAPPTRSGSQPKERRRPPRTAGQKSSARSALTENATPSPNTNSNPGRNPMAKVTEPQDENVNYSA